MAERGKGFGCHARFPVDTGGGSSWFNRLKVQRPDKVFGHRLPEFTHGDIRIFIIFKDICREYISARRLIRDGHALFFRPVGHVAKEIIHKQTVDYLPPVVQEAGGRLRIVYHIAEKSRQPFPQRVTGSLFKLLLHTAGPGLCPAFPAIEKDAFQKPACQRAVGESSQVSVKLCVGTIRR